MGEPLNRRRAASASVRITEIRISSRHPIASSTPRKSAAAGPSLGQSAMTSSSAFTAGERASTFGKPGDDHGTFPAGDAIAAVL